MRAALLAIFVFFSLPAYAYDTSGALPDAAQEQRARDLFRELRCMVCQNQSIDDSDAPLAKDLRVLVRERVAAGESDEAIKAFLVERYGQFVLLRPAFSVETLLLWATPIAFFLAAAAVALIGARRRNRLQNQDNLTSSEKKKLDAILRRDA